MRLDSSLCPDSNDGNPRSPRPRRYPYSKAHKPAEFPPLLTTYMAGGRKTKHSAPPPPSTTLVLDNGAYTLKSGIVTDGTEDRPRVVPNCIARDRSRKLYVGSDLDNCRDFGEIQFRRPVEKGYIVNWEAQKEVWDHEFFDDTAPQKCDPSESRLILAEQPNSLPALQSICDQMVFEEFQFASYYRGIGEPLCDRRALSMSFFLS